MDAWTSPHTSPDSGLTNFREAGGHAAAGGRMMAQGVLFRCGELSRLTGPGEELLRQLGIRTICDLRSREESRKRPARLGAVSALRVVNLPVQEHATQDGSRMRLVGFVFRREGGALYRAFCHHYYRQMAFQQTGRIREIVTLLATEGNLPAVIHCAAGKDRTGFVVALLQLFAGVRWETVLAEYLRTNEFLGPRVERMIRITRLLTMHWIPEERMRLILTTHPEFLTAVYQEIVDRHGTVEAYLREACGIPDGVLERLRNLLLR